VIRTRWAKPLCANFLRAKSGNVNARFLDIKHLHSVWVADAANFHSSQVSNYLCLFASIYMFQCPANFYPTYLIILKFVVKSMLYKTVKGKGYCLQNIWGERERGGGEGERGRVSVRVSVSVSVCVCVCVCIDTYQVSFSKHFKFSCFHGGELVVTVALLKDTTPALQRNIVQMFSSSAKQHHQLQGRGGGTGSHTNYIHIHIYKF
jgi:hypothetical protein